MYNAIMTGHAHTIVGTKTGQVYIPDQHIK